MRRRRARRQTPAALNEGRDVNPGDTLRLSSSLHVATIAQRRPGRESRRHRVFDGPTRARRFARTLNEGRDVNPGDTPDRVERAHRRPVSTAQRRPGRESRRHTRTFGVEYRERSATALNEGRDVNPGDTGGRSAASSTAGTLNEGRDVNPGDTHDPSSAHGPHGDRSTKAGT